MRSSNLINLTIPELDLEEIISNLIATRDLNLGVINLVTEGKAKDTIEKKILEIEKQIAILDRTRLQIGDKVLNFDLVGTLLEIYLETNRNINVQDRQLLYKIHWDKDCPPKFANTTNTYYIYNLIRVNPAIKYRRLASALYLHEIV